MFTSITEYLHELFDLSVHTEVRDKCGGRMSLDKAGELAVEMLLKVRSDSKKVMLVGNGGSAALVSHMQNDVCKAVDTKGLVFTEQPLLMALSWIVLINASLPPSKFNELKIFPFE